ncbi:DMT family transporter [Acidisphaera sp. L21]|uniref:DMT family transporter n=1 Tax=Acidisphaera sp. L21 TaxID=1641851 RepID=UPI00131BBCB3|nr:EamA family transporter [Acidisphaera sp. L21]
MKIERAHILFAVICVVWGTTWIAAKIGISAVPPLLFVGTRFVLAGAVLMLFTRANGAPLLPARADLPRFGIVTLLMVIGTYAPLFWGAKFVSSGLASILNLAFMPVALLLIGTALREDRITPIRGLGVAIGIAGLLLLFGPKAMSGHGAGGSMELAGSLAIVASALLYSCGSVMARPLLRRYSPVQVSGLTTTLGGLALLAISLAFEPGAIAALDGQWGAPAWAGWWFLVLFGSLAAYPAYLLLVREWGAARAGAYAFVSPIFAVLLGIIVFGEHATLTDALGMLTMLAGAFLSLRGEASVPARLPGRVAD